MAARIYRPAKTATSSGRARTLSWVLEMEPQTRKVADPVCGWIGSGDTEQQLMLRFPTKEAAIAYAKRRKLDYRVFEPQERQVRLKSYSENFIRRV